MPASLIRSSVVLALAVTVFVAACAAPPARGPEAPARPRRPVDLPEPPVPEPVIDVPDLEARSMLLLLADRQIWEPFTVRQSIEGDPTLRRELAATLGRAHRPEGRSSLEGLLLDRDAEVRREAIFALGVLGDEAARPALLRQVGGEDRESAVLAVEALAKLDTPLLVVAAQLLEVSEEELWRRLLPSLYRFPRDADQLDLARAAIERAPDPALVARAAYALTRDAVPAAADDVRGLVDSPDPWVRGWAARALGAVGAAEDLPRLRPLLDDPEPGPPIQALRAVAALAADGRAAAPVQWRDRLLALFDDPRPGVRITALEVSSAWLGDEAIAAALLSRADGSEGRESEVALAALARGRDPRAAERVSRMATASDPSRRRFAAQVAGVAGLDEVLGRLTDDLDPTVRTAALGARLEAGQGLPAAERGLIDRDPAARARAVEWLTEHPEVPYERIVAAMAGPGWRRQTELGTDGVAALVARASAEPLERGAIVEVIEQLAVGGHHLVRRAAADALVELGRPRTDPGPVETTKDPGGYRLVVQLTREPQRVVLTTSRGEVRLRLDCPRAPLTCLNFVQLAGQGFYDGLVFHRVVPDFVVQGGDPRGDGWGGPGYTIRDEINRLRFERGVVGMALAGPDTGGSQFFVTLSPQPHLDGGFTAFAVVESGMEVLDRIVQGDRIEKAVVVP